MASGQQLRSSASPAVLGHSALSAQTAHFIRLFGLRPDTRRTIVLKIWRVPERAFGQIARSARNFC